MVLRGHFKYYRPTFPENSLAYYGNWLTVQDKECDWLVISGCNSYQYENHSNNIGLRTVWAPQAQDKECDWLVIVTDILGNYMATII